MDAIRILTEAGYVEHIDMIESLRLHVTRPVVCDEAGVLVTNDEGYWSLAVFDERETKRFVDAVPRENAFVTSHCAAVSQALVQRGFAMDMHCRQACLVQRRTVAERKGISFRVLDLADESFVVENYHMTGPDYIRERLESGMLYGVEVEGTLAGFMGLHVEGAMGMLEILPAFRRRGLAMTLEAWVCGRLQDEGKVPYCHIIEGNEASMALHRKLGFRFSSKRLDWLT